MKHYALAMVNKTTGAIEHIATSPAPLSDDRVGKPVNWETTHILKRFEFDAEPDAGCNIMRARTALLEFEMAGNTATEKSAAIALVKRKSGRTRAANIQTS